MNKSKWWKIFTVLGLLALVAVCTPLAAQVYKTVDENGNVVYTDQPPQEGAEPMQLRPLSIVEAPDYQEAARPAAEEAAAEPGEQTFTLRELRRRFAGFAIISPENEQSLWNPQGMITLAWQAPHPLEDGMQVQASMDGRQLGATTDRVIPITDLERGEHLLEAVLVDARGRTIATAEPVTIFIRQPSIFINANRAGQQGG